MSRYREHVQADGEALIAAVAAAPEAQVTACPGWDTTKLAGHVGFVWAMVTNVLRTRPESFERPGPEAVAPDQGVATWLGERHAAILDALDATPEDTAMWTWTERRDAGFFHRRMAMETAVHRWDAQAASGVADPVARALAVDGIDEITEVGWRSSLSRQIPPLPAGSLHLHCTDGDGEWLIRNVDGDLVVTHEHAKGDAAVRGAASDLFLYLWGRVGDDAVEVLGDAAVAHAWRSHAP